MPSKPVRPPGQDATVRATTESVTAWFAEHARDLPWRHPDCSPWGILVSEVMLQQTPVNRVVGPWRTWLVQWPTPAALAADTAGHAVRAWGRLGYPRRALRLHAAAIAIEERHDGQVPRDVADLLALPGVGTYTAAAVASFAFGEAHPVLDTNVRRVLARLFQGIEFPESSPRAVERQFAAAIMPVGSEAAWAAASMELGALVCTAANPSCLMCPVSSHCEWFRAGRPQQARSTRRGRTFVGSDRQVRGMLLQILRDNDEAVPRHRLDSIWADASQRDRALASLISDGLVVHRNGCYQLP